MFWGMSVYSGQTQADVMEERKKKNQTKITARNTTR